MGSDYTLGKGIGDILTEHENMIQNMKNRIPGRITTPTTENLKNEILKVVEIRKTILDIIHTLEQGKENFKELAGSERYKDLITQFELLDASVSTTVQTHLFALKVLVSLREEGESTEDIDKAIHFLSENLDKKITANENTVQLRSAIGNIIAKHDLNGTFLNTLQSKMEEAFSTAVETGTCKEMKHLVAKIKEFTFSAEIDEPESQSIDINDPTQTGSPDLVNFGRLLKLVNTMAQTGKVNYFEVMNAKETLNEIKNSDSIIPSSKGNFDAYVAKLEKLLGELEKSCSSVPSH